MGISVFVWSIMSVGNTRKGFLSTLLLLCSACGFAKNKLLCYCISIPSN